MLLSQNVVSRISNKCLLRYTVTQRDNNTRKLSSSNQAIPSETACGSTLTEDDKHNFLAHFPTFIKDFVDCTKRIDPKFIHNKLQIALEYNVPNGKLIRGLSTVLACKQLLSPTQITPERMQLVFKFGWCMEAVQAASLVVDDIMDQSKTRRGKTSCYKVEGIGYNALNFAIMFLTGQYQIIEKYFGKTNVYAPLITMMRESLYATCVGQTEDKLMETKTVDDFKIETYNSLLNKTAIYSSYMPITAALYICGYEDPEIFALTKPILQRIGRLFQIQDDYLDCFADPANWLKKGTDIESNKCTWLAVVCMQRASEDQKRIMKEGYGQKDAAKVDQIKKLYSEMQLPKLYSQFEEHEYNRIISSIRGLPSENVQAAVLSHLHMIYRRAW